MILVNHPTYIASFVKECSALGLDLHQTADLLRGHRIQQLCENVPEFRQGFEEEAEKLAAFKGPLAMMSRLPGGPRALSPFSPAIKSPWAKLLGVAGLGAGVGALGKSIVSPETPDIGKVRTSPDVRGFIMGGRGGGSPAAGMPATGIFGIPLGQGAATSEAPSSPYFTQLQGIGRRSKDITGQLAALESQGLSAGTGIGGALTRLQIARQRSQLNREQNELLNGSKSFLGRARMGQQQTLRDIAKQRSLIHADQMASQGRIDDMAKQLESANGGGARGAIANIWNRVTNAEGRATQMYSSQQDRLRMLQQLQEMQQRTGELLPASLQ